MASMIFSDDEAKYLRAVLKWQEKPSDDNRASWMPGMRTPRPVGEFRTLMIGAKGVGKTSILKKVGRGLHLTVESLLSSYFFSRAVLHGCLSRPFESGLVQQYQQLPTQHHHRVK